MSIFEYRASAQIAAADWPFDALIMAAYRKADTFNAATLERAFPEQVAELKERYELPGGLRPAERDPERIDEPTPNGAP